MKSVLKKLAVVATAVGVVVAGGVAYALWSATGSGSGTATALTAQTITVTAATGAADLYPGFTQGDVYFTVSNNNPYAVTFASMTPGTITSSNEGACPAAKLTVASATGLGMAVAGNASNVAQSIPNVVTLASDAPDGCQGVTFTIALTLSGTQS